MVYKFNPISDDVEVVKKNLCVSVNSGQMYEHIVGRPNFSFDFNITDQGDADVAVLKSVAIKTIEGV